MSKQSDEADAAAEMDGWRQDQIQKGILDGYMIGDDGPYRPNFPKEGLPTIEGGNVK